jgi:hypothetical protein
MSNNHDGPATLTFARNLKNVSERFAQAANLLLHSAAAPWRETLISRANTLAADSTTRDRLAMDIVQLRIRALEVRLQQLAPAYQLPAELLNAYLNWATVDQQSGPYSALGGNIGRCALLRRATADAYIAGLMLSIRSGLDMLVPILASYYHAIPLHTGWGKNLGDTQWTGWMARVVRETSCDDLLLRTHDAYRRWIGIDLVQGHRHMADVAGMLSWAYSDQEKRLVDGRWRSPEGCAAYRYAAGLLACVVNEWYRFANDVLITLSERETVAPRAPWIPPSARGKPHTHK